MTAIAWDYNHILPQVTTSDQVAQNSTQVPLEIASFHGLEVGNIQSENSATVELDEDGRLIYTPPTDFLGIDKVELTVLNGSGIDAANTTYTTYVHVTESVYAIPDWTQLAPSAGQVSIDVLGNDYWFGTAIENPLNLIQVTDAMNGTAAISEDGTRVVYTPSNGFEGVDEFAYIVKDAYGNESTGTSKVHVTPDADRGTYSNAEHFFIEALGQKVANNRHQFGAPSWDGRLYFSGEWDRALVTLPFLGTQQQSSLAVSSTNQVAGVEEGDLVKRIGDRVFIASGNDLKIVDASDATNPKLFKSISFDDPILDIYASEGRLTVITDPANGSSTSAHFQVSAGALVPTSKAEVPPEFTVSVLDIRDAANFEIIYSTEVAGDYRDSRFINGNLYVVADHSESLQLDNLKTVATETIDDEVIEADSIRFSSLVFFGGHNGQQYFTESIGSYVERVSTDVAFGSYSVENNEGTQSGELFDWSDIPANFAEVEAAGSIITFDTLGDSGIPTDADAVDFAGSGFTMYASQNAIYLLGSTLIDNETSDGVVSDWAWSFRRSQSYGTSIQKFALHDDGQGVDFVSRGEVIGSLSDQFSADEHDGYFRIATTEHNWGGEVNLYVLQQYGEDLEVVGSVEDIAPNERIYSTRFDGDRVFIRTYRKVDPLFVIDLSDPTTPTIQGELKIPSYSNYMQVINEDYILGIGRDANDGMYDGLQVSLFNVSDPTDPRLVAKYEFVGGRDTWSSVADAWNLLDHQAITFVAESGILAIPTHTSSRWGGGNSSGTDEAISVLKIDIENESVELLGAMEFDERAERSMHINGYLYGISGEEIQVAGLASPETIVGTLQLGDEAMTEVADLAFAALSSQVVETGENGSNEEINASEIITDVNGDGETTPLDAVLLLNMMNEGKLGEITADMNSKSDVNQDGSFSPVDILGVINKLNEQSALEKQRLAEAADDGAPNSFSFSFVAMGGNADDEE